MKKMICALLALSSVGLVVPAANAATYTETFDGTSTTDNTGTFGQWKSRWFGQNSNAAHNEYLYPNNRGNNGTGLTIYDGNPDDGRQANIFFDTAFGASLVNFSFDILSYNSQNLIVFDMSGNELLNVWLDAVSGPPYDFAQSNYTHFSVDSTNGIGGFKTLPFGAEGNVSIDNLVATTAAVPEPASWAMMIAGLGFAGAALRRTRRAALRFA